MKRNVVLAITGASGAIYAVRLLDVLVASGCDVQLAISPAGSAVFRQELGLEVDVNEFRLDSLLPTRKELAALERFKQVRELIGVDAWQYEGTSVGDANPPRRAAYSTIIIKIFSPRWPVARPGPMAWSCAPARAGH